MLCRGWRKRCWEWSLNFTLRNKVEGTPFIERANFFEIDSTISWSWMKKLGLREAKPLCPHVIHLRNGRSRFKASDSKDHILFLFLYLFGGGGCAGSSWLCQDFCSCSKQGLLSSCHVWASHCGGFSCCRAQALGCTASAVVVHRLSCPATCGIFPVQESNPCSLHWQVDS